MATLKDEQTQIRGPAGSLEVSISPVGQNKVNIEKVSVICHPHPLHGGTKDNKVVHTLARTFRDMAIPAIRFNFRGVGKSEGEYDNGLGEMDDLLSLIDFAKREYPNAKIILAGFSFGAYIAHKVFVKLGSDTFHKLILVAPPVAYEDYPSLTENASEGIQIIHGSEDELVSLDSINIWLQKQNQQYKEAMQLNVIAGASHFFHGQLLELKSLLSE